jgi:hypothetical protein
MTPGPWHVEDRPHEPEDRVLSMARADEAPFDWNCSVAEGEVTVFVVDLRWQEDLRVRGRLALDGVGAAGWSAVIEAPMGADREYHLPPTQLDELGRFAAEALPGAAELVLRSPPGEQPLRALIVEIRVNEDLQPFELDLPTGTLSGRAEPGSRLRLHHRIDASTHLELESQADDAGVFVIAGVPAGESSLQREGPPQKVTIVAGETTRLP